MTGASSTALSKFGLWLKEYSEKNQIAFSALAAKASLSSGALLRILNEPERKPAMDTCIKLAAATGEDLNKLLKLAGRPVVDNPQVVNPLRNELLTIFDKLSPAKQASLLGVARAMCC